MPPSSRGRPAALASTVGLTLALAYGCGAAATEPSATGEEARAAGSVPDRDAEALVSDAAALPDAVAREASSAGDAAPRGDAGDASVAGETVDASDASDARDAAAVPPPDPPGPLSAAYVDYAINHILITGQSNAVSNGGDPPLSTAQPFSNLMFDTGVMPMTSCSGDGCDRYQVPSAFVPLVENDDFFGYDVETPANGLADEISHLALQRFAFGVRAGYPARHDVLTSNHGRSGNTYWCLRKGFCTYNLERGHTSPFAQGMQEVESAKALAAAAGKTYVVRAAMAIHGESDHYAYVGGASEFPLPGTDGTPNKIKDYSDALVEWQEDYQASVRAITGQAQPVPLFISGLSGFTTTRTSAVLQWQLDAHVRAPGKVVYVTPAYPISVREDCLHYDNHGLRRLGEYFAKAYARVVLAGEAWEPVRPKQITRVGNVVTVRYHVPAPPLTLDTIHVTDPGSYGFDFVDNGALVPVASVAVVAPDTVRVTLLAAPSGVGSRLRYAQNQDVNVGTRCIGPGTVRGGGARGNLRDSDATPSRYGYDLWNWGANFDLAVP